MYIQITDQDMADTYQPPFRACIQQGNASCLMCSYNSVNGVPACANHDLLQKARTEWGFQGWYFPSHFYNKICEGSDILQRLIIMFHHTMLQIHHVGLWCCGYYIWKPELHKNTRGCSCQCSQSRFQMLSLDISNNTLT